MNTVLPRLSQSARKLPVAQATAAVPRREYPERDFGVGYGRSSGYASTRQYATRWNGPLLFRCV